MGERMKAISRVRVPNFSMLYDQQGKLKRNKGKMYKKMTHAVKSALPEAALDPSRESFVLQTAPLWPRKVPIQSPVHSLNIGFPSLQLDTKRKVPSS